MFLIIFVVVVVVVVAVVKVIEHYGSKYGTNGRLEVV